MCEHLHCLPQPGGLFDQDSFFVYGMDMVVEAKRIKELEEQHRNRNTRR